MLGKNTVKNLKSIGKLKPSLLITENENFISASLYIKKPSDDFDYETIGHVSAIKTTNKIDNRSIYKITGTSGAYPGFGSLAYQSLLIAIKQLDRAGLLISDRESVSGSAEGIYRKLVENDSYEKKPIPDDSCLFSTELESEVYPNILEELNLDTEMEWDCYRELIRSGDIKPYYLNTAYSFKENPESERYHKMLLSNNNSNRLTDNEMKLICEFGEILGEWVDNNIDNMTKLRDDNYSELVSGKKIDEIFPEPDF